LQVIQLLGHADQVAAFEAKRVGRRVPIFQIQAVTAQLFALRKAIGKDLVKHRVFYPVWCRNRHAFSKVDGRFKAPLKFLSAI
jgi:hypothetical protein